MSIRLRLIAILILATGGVWLSAVLWIENSTRAHIEQVLDARLAESANMVSSLISDQRITLGEGSGQPTVTLPMINYSNQLSCQIWSLDGELVGASASAPAGRLTDEVGFSTRVINGETWRIYSQHNNRLGVRVMVGDRVDMRHRLVRDMIEGLLTPAAIIAPVLALLIWLGVTRGLAPLQNLADSLRSRSPLDLTPLPDNHDASEIRPVRRALNSLFHELDRVRRSERDFTAFAAHELKTPLAGLRAQAQIAQMAPDQATRDKALEAILASVDRSDRMVTQLLQLATVDTDTTGFTTISLDALFDEVIFDLASISPDVTVIKQGPTGLKIEANRFLIYSALRNIVENAVLASTAGQTVMIEAFLQAGRIGIAVSDKGPGIAPADRPRILQRFYRGAHSGANGSGLGLAIAGAAAERHGAKISFPQSEGGQRVIISGFSISKDLSGNQDQPG